MSAASSASSASSIGSVSACSDPTLAPGPLAALDENVNLDTPSPPVFGPLAKEFSDSLPGFYSALDESIGVLAAESAIDIGEGIADGLGAVAHAFSSGINQEALTNLQAAEDGFRVARDKTASLQAGVPSDVQQPTGFYLLDFIVEAADGTRVPGALVQLDADFGTGATRATDGNGICLFPVAVDATVAYTVSAAGFAIASGVARASTTVVTVRVTLTAA